MPEPRYRSRSKKRKKIVTPSGENKIHYVGKKTKVPTCAICHQQLHGVPRTNKVMSSRLNKVKKRPDRMYGGYLCPRCVKKKLKNVIRTEYIT
ncbi:MAG: 50S ribosomal protein L34e [Candidatus Helarchaeota archaeon]